MTHSKMGFIRALIMAVWNAMDDRNLGLIAAGVAYYAMFAIFPAMAATIALWGYFSDPTVISSYLQTVAEFIPDQAYELIESRLTALIEANVTTLGWPSVVSLGVALYSARAGVSALIRGLNAIHSCKNRGGIRHFIVAILITLALIAVVLTALTTVVVVPLALALIPFGAATGGVVAALPWVVMFLMVLGTLGIIYRYGPNRQGNRDKWITAGAALASLLWALASLAFSIYLANFGSYNEVYGSIGAVIALLMWFYISAYTVLLGAAVNAELARMRQVQ